MASLPLAGWGVPAAGASEGPVLVVAAHPDDEALGFAGIIDQARASGRRVLVAIVTNGELGQAGSGTGACGTSNESRSRAAQFGLVRNQESLDGMGVLGLAWSPDPAQTEIAFLGYGDGTLTQVAGSAVPVTTYSTGLSQTFALDADASTATCNGDLRYLLSGRHSDYDRDGLAEDLDALLALVQPSDVYTHVSFDGHPDHTVIAEEVRAAVERGGVEVTVHGTLIHPQGSSACPRESAYQWPNPPTTANDPYARFTPALDVTAPPTPACSSEPTGSSWGPLGAPDEVVEVPAAMQAATEATNRKWAVVSRYASQIDCSQDPEGTYAPSCGYMRSFVKRSEFFWSERVGGPVPPPPPAPPGSFGATAPGTSVDRPGAGYKFGSVFALGEYASPVSLRFYAAGGSSPQSFVTAIYAVDGSDRPTSLVTQGAQVSVAAGQPAGWVSSALPAGTTLAPGRYQLAVLSGPSSANAVLSYAPEPGGGTYNANPFPSPSATWGDANPGSARWSFAVDYEPAEAPVDAEAPTVALTAPAPGATVSGPATITASASDDVGVAEVDLLVDGAVVATRSAPPYSTSWDTTTVANGSHTLTARARDYAANATTSAAVVVQVLNRKFASDDFSAPTLDTDRWSFVDPLGDASVSVNGTQAVISVPGGASHYVWTEGARAPRLVQAVDDGDFEIEAKFQTQFSGPTQVQGLIVEQDPGNFVRFDVSQVSCRLELAAASIAGSSGTGFFVRPIRGGDDLYLRVRRAGSTWTFSYSYDGQAWTNAGSFGRSMTVTQVGPFAGNAGSPAPAFVARIDYAVLRSAPPPSEDGQPFAPPPAPPAIDVWYGDTQTFGRNGRPQEWVNVLGRVSDADGVTSLRAVLNGGPSQALSLGEDTTRLVAPGDFNAEIDFDSLVPGPNTLVLTATDTTGASSTRTVTVNRVDGTAPGNFVVDWSSASRIDDVAQVSDGRWDLLPDGTVRTAETGYDRLIEVGDMGATDYEVQAEVTIWDLPCGGAALGLVAGWKGHTTDQYGIPTPVQPRIGHPFAAFAEYLLAPGQAPRLSIGANTARYQEAELAADLSGRRLELGVAYVFKMRVEATLSGTSSVSFKVWAVGAVEPAGWDLQAETDPSEGSVVLAAHMADVSFGKVTFTSL